MSYPFYSLFCKFSADYLLLRRLQHFILPMSTGSHIILNAWTPSRNIEKPEPPMNLPDLQN